MLDSLLSGNIFALMTIFARIGSAIFLMPGLGDPQVLRRTRLLIALALSLLLMPLIAEDLPPRPTEPLRLFLLLLGEVVIGIFAGLVMRFLLTALDIAGYMISHYASLNAAQVFNPSLESQGSLVGAFLTTLGLVLIFTSGLHHLMIQAIVNSYDLMPPGEMLMVQDMANALARTLSTSFRLGVQMSAPMIVVGSMFFLGMGILARLMPQMPVFFVMIPMKFVISALVLGLTLGSLSLYFLDQFEARITTVLG